MNARPHDGRWGWVTRAYAAWLAAATVSSLGDAVIAFALTWTATGLGGGVAGTLRTVAIVPTVALLLLGGAIGDRWGQRRLLVVTTLAQLGQYALLLALLGGGLPLLAVLGVNAVVAGALQGLRSPSTAAYARQLVAPEDVQRGIGLSQTVGSVARTLAPALGAAAFAVLGLRGSTAVQLVSFLGVLAVLLVVRPPHAWPLPQRRGPLWRTALEGLSSVGRDRVVRRLLAATSLVAASLLPLVALLLPLLARHHGWGPATAGLLEGAWVAGSTATGLVLGARWAAGRRVPGWVAVSGPAVAGACAAALALLPGGSGAWPPVAVGVCALMGVGTSMFTANVAPLFVAATPPELTSRWSAVLTLAQFLPLVVMNPLLGTLADRAGIGGALAVCAVLAVAAAGVMRGGSSPGPGSDPA